MLPTDLHHYPSFGVFQNNAGGINASLPVNSLPNELLIEIFFHFRDLHHPVHASRRILDLSVCQRWRELVCSTPRFWARIDVQSSFEWLKLSLARSCKTAVDIIFHDETVERPELPLLIDEHADHIRSLAFPQAEPSWAESIQSLLLCHLSELQRLEITHATEGRVHTWSPELSPSVLARLESLKIVGYSVPVEVADCRRLRKLELAQSPLPTSLRNFLSALNQNTVLEELSFGDSYDIIPGTLQLPKPTFRPPIALPRLRRFHAVSGSSVVLHHILTDICCPNATDIKVSLKGPDFRTSPLVPEGGFLEHCLFASPHHPTTIFPTLTSAISLGLTVDQYTCKCEILARGPNLNAQLGVYEKRPRACWAFPYMLLPLCLRDLTKYFTGAAITEISIYACGFEKKAPPTVFDWETFFAAFPRVETLKIDIRKSMAMWAGLRNSSDTAAPHLLCPALKVIRVVERKLHTSYRDMVESVVDVLRYRASLGSRIQRFDLVIWVGLPHEPKPEDDGVFMTRLGQLKELADVLEFTAKYL